MQIDWRDVRLPEFGLSTEPPQIPPRIYESRCRRAYAAARTDWLVVYGDREHSANLAYLTGFDPRFEEAALLVGPADRRVLVLGNEGMGYASAARLPVELALCQSFSLPGQDRSVAPHLRPVLRAAGIQPGQVIGLAGWKYLEDFEAEGELPGLFAPAVLVDALRDLAGDAAGVRDVTAVLMHPTRGLRANNEVEQIAAFEWSATRATLAVWRVVTGARPGMTELEAMANMGYAGEPMTCHPMLASEAGQPIVGLRSPTARCLRRGDGITTAIAYWGGLGCRAGLLDDHNDDFLNRLAIPYFRGVAAWYQSVVLGVTGASIHERVGAVLAEGGLHSMLNPGHLTSLDEWFHSPMRPGSTEPIASGMAFQADIIPQPVPAGWAINCEDPLVFADADLRAALARQYPETWSRIRARQDFMRGELGINIADEVLPLSATPAVLPPLWLAASRVLVLA
jgi:hypothetical protein